MTEQGGAHPSAHMGDGEHIRTYPFDPSASVSGVGIQIGPMGTEGPGRAASACRAACTGSISTSCSSSARARSAT